MTRTLEDPGRPPVALSFVVPVYNGAATIEAVVDSILREFDDLAIEIVLVDDGSEDGSVGACSRLVERHRGRVLLLELARNFGEHAAVLAGLAHTSGRAVAVLDDDGQNPPAEVRKLHDKLLRDDLDVVYGRYVAKRHGRLRNLGSRFNDRMANVMLKKPRWLYLSSFKVLNRFIVEEILRYRGAFPYVDGLILRSTARLGQVDVRHEARREGSSNYTLRKLLRLWLNMFLNFSILPLRISALLGVATAGISLLLLVAIVVDKLYINPGVARGLPTVLVVVTLFAGVQLVILGTMGEYLGRLFLDHSNSPQYVVRRVRGESDE
jgi:undecaprenyl-phosphate 4-deoxy-4-formamido-L-arabinose transferase